MNRGTNKRYDFHFNAVAKQNHPELLEQGAGLARATASERKEKELKQNLLDAKYALDTHQNAKKSATPKPVGKAK